MLQSESTDLVPGHCADDEGVEGALALYQVVVVALQQQGRPIPPATNIGSLESYLRIIRTKRALFYLV